MINYKDLELVDDPDFSELSEATENLVKAMTELKTLPSDAELSNLQTILCGAAMEAFFGDKILDVLKANALEHILKAINEQA